MKMIEIERKKKYRLIDRAKKGNEHEKKKVINRDNRNNGATFYYSKNSNYKLFKKNDTKLI